MAVRFSSQADEIMAICSRLNIQPDELGERAGVAAETMRKYAKGYQKASSNVMQGLRNVERIAILIHAGAPPKKPDATRLHAWMETQTLDRTLQDLTARLVKSTPSDRRNIITNIKDVVEELQSRKAGNLTEAQQIAKRAGDALSNSERGLKEIAENDDRHEAAADRILLEGIANAKHHK
ncbi:hypothetical protein [Silvimonas sp.]|uniref:hypothetical protein n=1 Tax=Silvimonas sp. TaxID=2650811 RepID=UPI002844BB5D|nr:hypothetical protein [Silvimonas sp.]MDR3427836.1 hypothetical protein [Silvimonas sp.]